MAGQPAHPFREIESATLAAPNGPGSRGRTGIAQIDQMRAGIGQRDYSGLVLDQRLYPSSKH